MLLGTSVVIASLCSYSLYRDIHNKNEFENEYLMTGVYRDMKRMEGCLNSYHDEVVTKTTKFINKLHNKGYGKIERYDCNGDKYFELVPVKQKCWTQNSSITNVLGRIYLDDNYILNLKDSVIHFPKKDEEIDNDIKTVTEHIPSYSYMTLFGRVHNKCIDVKVLGDYDQVNNYVKEECYGVDEKLMALKFVTILSSLGLAGLCIFDRIH